MYSASKEGPQVNLRLIPQPGQRNRRELRPLSAIVFIPPGTPASAQWRDTCGDYCQRKGYRLAGIVAQWDDVIQLITDGEADVVIVGRRDHLARDRSPRLEIVTEEGAELPTAQRRPQRRAREAG